MLTIIFFLLFAQLVRAQQPASANNQLLLEYYQTQRYADAAALLKKDYPEPVTDPKILSSLAYSSQMAGKFNDAEGYYQRIYDQDSTNTAVLFNLGGINLRRGNNRKALLYYKKILLKDTTNINVYTQLASLSKNLGDIISMVNYLIKANHLNPEEPDVAYDLVEAYEALNFHQQAAKILEPALAADTLNLLLLQAKAQVSVALKDFKTAATACTRLINQGQKSNTVVTWLGESDFMLKRYQECINAFRILDTLKTQNETSCYYVAMAYKALHNQDMAIHYLEEAIKQGISPNIDDYYSEIADSYDTLHKSKQAIAAYQKSLEFEEKPLTFYALANIYDVNLKDKKKAMKYYKKYLASKPPQKQKNYIAYSQVRIKALGH
jgi:tetratricopeptide (TPR) repeat protein